MASIFPSRNKYMDKGGWPCGWPRHFSCRFCFFCVLAIECKEGSRYRNQLYMSFWRDRKVFVTGGTGLLGSWLVKRLIAAEADVLCLVRDWVPQSELVRSGDIEHVTTVRGDITDQALMGRIPGENEIQTVLHVSAAAIVQIANRNPISSFETNIKGTSCLLEACRPSPLEKETLVASSDKAYGAHPRFP